MNIDIYKSPVGLIRVEVENDLLVGLSIQNIIAEELNPSPMTKVVAAQLDAYFSKKLNEFSVPLGFGEASPFYLKVWAALRDIPYGKTISYLELAQAIGDAKAVRAVGTANGKNPIAIIVPCHRVIGSDGSMTGYAYGIDVKRKLLFHENPVTYGYTKDLFE